MANPRHLETLRKGVREWNRWREKHLAVRPDLSDAILTDCEFRGIDLRNANLHNATILGADLYGANLMEADLSEADLSHDPAAGFAPTTLSNADLTWAVLIGTNLSGAKFSDVKLWRADFRRAKLCNADIRYALDLVQDQIDVADGDTDTQLPPRINRPLHWITPCK